MRKFDILRKRCYGHSSCRPQALEQHSAQGLWGRLLPVQGRETACWTVVQCAGGTVAHPLPRCPKVKPNIGLLGRAGMFFRAKPPCVKGGRTRAHLVPAVLGTVQIIACHTSLLCKSHKPTWQMQTRPLAVDNRTDFQGAKSCDSLRFGAGLLWRATTQPRPTSRGRRRVRSAYQHRGTGPIATAWRAARIIQ